MRVSRFKKQELVRALSIAGDPENIEAAVRTEQPIDIAQFPDTAVYERDADIARKTPGCCPMFVTPGVFGSDITYALASMNGQQRARITALAERHRIGFLESPTDLLLLFAFSNSPDGVVIISIFDTKHIEATSRPPACLRSQASLPRSATARRKRQIIGSPAPERLSHCSKLRIFTITNRVIADTPSSAHPLALPSNDREVDILSRYNRDLSYRYYDIVTHRMISILRHKSAGLR